MPIVPTAKKCPLMGLPQCVVLLKDEGTEWGICCREEGLDSEHLFSLRIFPLGCPKLIHKWSSDNSYFPISTNPTYLSPNVLTSVFILLMLLCKSFLCHFLNSVQKSHQLIHRNSGQPCGPKPRPSILLICYSLKYHLIPLINSCHSNN